MSKKIVDFFASSSDVAEQPQAAPTRASRKAKPEPQSIDRERIEREARELSPDVPQSLANLFWLDEHLHVSRDVPRFSPWMRFALTEFYADNAERPERTWLAVCAGRGGGKSTLATKFATAEGMLTARRVPRGERHAFGFVSVPHDAVRRVRGIEEYVGAFGVAGALALAPQPKLELDDARGNAIAFVALSAKVTSVSGPTFVGVVVDEEAKMLTHDRSQINSIDEIMASIVPALRTRDVRNLRISSPLDACGSFFEAIRAGTNVVTLVARLGPDFVAAARDGYLEVARWEEGQGNKFGAERARAWASQMNPSTKSIPSWVANPSLSAVRARKDAEAIPVSKLAGRSRFEYWAREFGAIPLAPPYAVVHGLNDGLAEANARLNGRGVDNGLKRWDHLPASDQRSTRYREPSVARREDGLFGLPRSPRIYL